MHNAIFVVPYGMETSLRFVRAAARLQGVRLGLISQEPAERLPEDVRSGVAAFERVKNALDPDQLETAVRSMAREWGGQVDRLIGILEQLQEPLGVVRERLSIRGMDSATALNFRDKSVMKDALRNAGLPCARHALAASLDQAIHGGEQIGYPMIVKPPDGAGAKGTCRVENAEELTSYLRMMPATPAKPVLLEEFITGREHSFDSVSIDGQHIFHSISQYYPSPLEVMESPWIQWCVLLPRSIDEPEYADIRDAGRRALDALGMVTGLTHMEWFRREDGSLAISEVGARPPGAQFTTLLSYAHDRDFYEAWAELMVFERFSSPERRYACGAVFLRGQGAGGHVVAVHGLERVREELGDLVVEARIPRVGQGQASSYEGEGYVILRHPETDVVREGLKKLLGLVRVELGQESPEQSERQSRN